MQKIRFFIYTCIIILLLLIGFYLTLSHRYYDEPVFWKNETKYQFPHDSLITSLVPFIDSLNDLIIIHYKSQGDEYYEFQKSLIIIKYTPNNFKLIYYDRQNNQTKTRSSIRCDSISDSHHQDSLFNLLSHDILSLHSLKSDACFGCESYVAYSRVKGNENAISWQTDDLMVFDRNYKKLSKVFQNVIKECEVKTTAK